jgi:predicted small metal-binding protein
MEKFACKDMGMKCDFVTTGKTVEEVRLKVMNHAQTAHADYLKTLTTPAQKAEMDKAVTKAIQHVA